MIEKGLQHTSEELVSISNVAKTVGSGDLEVYATPAMAALMENAAMQAVAKELPEGATTVGSLLQISHDRPSAIGEKVQATAILQEVEGRKLTFTVAATDSKGTIGAGKHVRYIVDIERFLSKIK